MIENYIGIDSDYIILGMAALLIVLLILLIVNMTQISGLKKKYKLFMSGKNGKSVEELVVSKLDQIDDLFVLGNENKKELKGIKDNMKFAFQKVGLVKYDAFHEMGGKLSFSLVMLNEVNDGFVLNAMHSREGCYTYIKEVIAGNSIIALAEEEKEALEMALSSK